MNATTKLVEPYLFFGGRCEEALDFYATALGGNISFKTYFKDSPEQMPAGSIPPGFENKIMHAVFNLGSTSIMASDGCDENADFRGFSLCVALDNVEEAKRIFSALSEGGEIKNPLAPSFWAEIYGVVKDKFGVEWMVNVERQQQQ